MEGVPGGGEAACAKALGLPTARGCGGTFFHPQRFTSRPRGPCDQPVWLLSAQVSAACRGPGRTADPCLDPSFAFHVFFRPCVSLCYFLTFNPHG